MGIQLLENSSKTKVSVKGIFKTISCIIFITIAEVLGGDFLFVLLLFGFGICLF